MVLMSWQSSEVLTSQATNSNSELRQDQPYLSESSSSSSFSFCSLILLSFRNCLSNLSIHFLVIMYTASSQFSHPKGSSCNKGIKLPKKWNNFERLLIMMYIALDHKCYISAALPILCTGGPAWASLPTVVMIDEWGPWHEGVVCTSWWSPSG